MRLPCRPTLNVLRLVALDVALVEPDAGGILTSLKLRDVVDVPWAETLSSLRTCMSSLLLLMLVAGGADTTAADAVDTAGEESLLFFPVLTDSRGTTRTANMMEVNLLHHYHLLSLYCL